MRRREERLGELLAGAGLVSSEEVAELLDAQRVPLPLASLCYVLGVADEETLVRELARQHGVPAVVLDRSIISLELFRGVVPDLAARHQVLPLFEDARHLIVAAEDPRATTDVMRELEFVRGKTVVPHVALKVTLARTLRGCLRASARGEAMFAGPLVERTAAAAPPAGAVFVVSPPEAEGDPAAAEAVAQRAVVEDITREIELEHMVEFDETWTGLSATELGAAAAGTRETELPAPVPRFEEPTNDLVRTWVRRGSSSGMTIDLDMMPGAGYVPTREVPPRVLVVDPDVAARAALMTELDELGYQISGASAGDEALDIITRDPPDAVVVDVMASEVDGFEVCRAIKQSRKFRRMAVILMVAVVDVGRITQEDVRLAGADDYHEKPIQLDRLRRRLQALMVARGAEARPGQSSFDQALQHYREGHIDDAVEELRRAIAADPTSAKHHFVLANLLHKRARALEAIDEYEATLEIKPDYFPALTRVAYLYYKQGYAAKAIDAWRRSLPLCPDPALRRNIEVFMRKLITDLPEG